MSERHEGTILFINDDVDEGKMLQIYLQDRRNDTVVICNPQYQALKTIIVDQKPDLILLNMAPPSYDDALQIFQEVKMLPEFDNIPIILWRVVKKLRDFYPIAKNLGAAGCIPYIFDIEVDFLPARDIVLAGGTYYPEND